MVNGGCQQLSMVSLMMRQGCRTWVVAKQFVAGGSGVSRVVVTHSGGVLVGLGVCCVILQLQLVFQREAE